MCVFLIPFLRYCELIVENRQFFVPFVYFGLLYGGRIKTSSRFWDEKTIVLGYMVQLSLRDDNLPVSVEHRLVTNRRTDTQTVTPRHIPR